MRHGSSAAPSWLASKCRTARRPDCSTIYAVAVIFCYAVIHYTCVLGTRDSLRDAATGEPLFSLQVKPGSPASSRQRSLPFRDVGRANRHSFTSYMAALAWTRSPRLASALELRQGILLGHVSLPSSWRAFGRAEELTRAAFLTPLAVRPLSPSCFE